MTNAVMQAPTGAVQVDSSTHRDVVGVASELVPIAVSFALSAAFIIRSASTLRGGRRAYLLFDDAAISLTYARNFATGHGLVWIAGQHPVEGYSNFLWTSWMAVIELARPSDQMAGLWVMVSGAVLLAANVYLIARIARRLSSDTRLVPFLAGLAAAVYYGLNSWTLVGMETGLVACLYSAAVLCALRACDESDPPKRSAALLVGCGTFLALAVLTRDDSLIVALVVIGFVLVRRRPAIKSAALIAAPVIIAAFGHLALRLDYYGMSVPNTYFLKIAGIPLTTRVVRGMVVLIQNATMQLVVPLVLSVAYLVLSRRYGRGPTRGVGILIGIIVTQALYLVYIGGDSYDLSYADRYLAPVIPFLFVIATLGAVELARAARDSSRPLVVSGIAIVAAGLFVMSSWLPVMRIQIWPALPWHLTSWATAVLVAGVVVVAVGVAARFGALSVGATALGLMMTAMLSTNAVPVATWSHSAFISHGLDLLTANEGLALAASTPPTATVAVTGAGNITFFDHRPSIDLLGYSDHFVATEKPHVFGYFMPGHDKWDYAYSIGKLRPDVVFGLFRPTQAELSKMTTWGYRSYVAPFGVVVYFLPGWFSPMHFATVSSHS